MSQFTPLQRPEVSRPPQRENTPKGVIRPPARQPVSSCAGPGHPTSQTTVFDSLRRGCQVESLPRSAPAGGVEGIPPSPRRVVTRLGVRSAACRVEVGGHLQARAEVPPGRQGAHLAGLPGWLRAGRSGGRRAAASRGISPCRHRQAGAHCSGLGRVNTERVSVASAVPRLGAGSWLLFSSCGPGPLCPPGFPTGPAPPPPASPHSLDSDG